MLIHPLESQIHRNRRPVQPISDVTPRTLAGRRLADRHHVPYCLADALAGLAGFREAL